MIKEPTQEHKTLIAQEKLFKSKEKIMNLLYWVLVAAVVLAVVLLAVFIINLLTPTVNKVY